MDGQTTIPTPIEQRWQQWRRGVLPFCIWMAAIGVFVLVARQRGKGIECVGWVQPRTHAVAATVTGRIVDIAADPLSVVLANQVVARLDDNPLEADILQAQTAVSRLRSELQAQSDQTQNDLQLDQTRWQADLRRFQAEEEGYRLEILKVRTDLEADKIQRQRLELQAARARQLVEAQAQGAANFDDARLFLREVERRIEENESLHGQLRLALQEARSRRTLFETRRPDGLTSASLLRPAELAIQEQERQVDALELARRGLNLQAPISGQVTSVLHAVGDVVLAGDPILVVTEPRPERIVAYARPWQVRQIAPAMTVLVRGGGQRLGNFAARIAEIGSTVELLPQRLWRDPRLPEYGQPFIVTIDPGVQLMPGEPLQIRVLKAVLP